MATCSLGLLTPRNNAQLRDRLLELQARPAELEQQRALPVCVIVSVRVPVLILVSLFNPALVLDTLTLPTSADFFSPDTWTHPCVFYRAVAVVRVRAEEGEQTAAEATRQLQVDFRCIPNFPDLAWHFSYHSSGVIFFSFHTDCGFNWLLSLP